MPRGNRKQAYNQHNRQQNTSQTSRQYSSSASSASGKQPEFTLEAKLYALMDNIFSPSNAMWVKCCDHLFGCMLSQSKPNSELIYEFLTSVTAWNLGLPKNFGWIIQQIKNSKALSKKFGKLLQKHAEYLVNNHCSELDIMLKRYFKGVHANQDSVGVLLFDVVICRLLEKLGYPQQSLLNQNVKDSKTMDGLTNMTFNQLIFHTVPKTLGFCNNTSIDEINRDIISSKQQLFKLTKRKILPLSYSDNWDNAGRSIIDLFESIRIQDNGINEITNYMAYSNNEADRQAASTRNTSISKFCQKVGYISIIMVICMCLLLCLLAICYGPDIIFIIHPIVDHLASLHGYLLAFFIVYKHYCSEEDTSNYAKKLKGQVEHFAGTKSEFNNDLCKPHAYMSTPDNTLLDNFIQECLDVLEKSVEQRGAVTSARQQGESPSYIQPTPSTGQRWRDPVSNGAGSASSSSSSSSTVVLSRPRSSGVANPVNTKVVFQFEGADVVWPYGHELNRHNGFIYRITHENSFAYMPKQIRENIERDSRHNEARALLQAYESGQLSRGGTSSGFKLLPGHRIYDFEVKAVSTGYRLYGNIFRHNGFTIFKVITGISKHT